MIGVILAGGSSRRVGIDKLFYPLKGKPIVLRLAERLARVRRIVKVVVIASYANANRFVEAGFETLVDMMMAGPAGAIYQALKIYNEIMVVAGDMPFLSSTSMENLISLCESGYDACIPTWNNGYLEPLFAIYRKGFLKTLERGLVKGILALHKLLSTARIIKVDICKVLRNPRYELYNVNSFRDLKEAEELSEATFIE